MSPFLLSPVLPLLPEPKYRNSYRPDSGKRSKMIYSMNSSLYHRESRRILGHRVTFIYEVTQRISSDSQITRHKKLVVATVSGPVINQFISADSRRDALQQSRLLIEGSGAYSSNVFQAWSD